MSKLNSILNDQSKFQKITRDPTEELQRRVNGLIASANAVVGEKLLTPIVGSYSPGYIYGNVKTHKETRALRPIISQVTTPIYKTAKQIDNIIKPYAPKKFSINSRDEFTELLRCANHGGLLASLDAESLFTNVPVTEKIQIILHNVYHHEQLPPPSIPKAIMEKLLHSCTTESPFRSPDNKLYRQINGVAMGSPLGPSFAEFYMCDIENRVLSDDELKPQIYCRYVDDVFVVVRDEDHLKDLQQQMEAQSALHFTYELGTNNNLPFLDIDVTVTGTEYSTTVYTKPTDLGKCMNPSGECPDRYRESTIRSYVHRAFKTCSSPELLDAELWRTKQVLVNNGYSNRAVDRVIKQHRERNNRPTAANHGISNKVYYGNQMSRAYRTDERVLQEIIHRNVRCTSQDDSLKLIVYYKNKKVNQLVMCNNPTLKRASLQQTNVVYEFKCPEEDCRLLQNMNYIGETSTTLSRRLTCHLSSGAPKQHMLNCHRTQLTRQMLNDCTSVIKKCPDPARLAITEALLIKERAPAINLQNTGLTRTLKLFGE
jgi:hypothetical protein